MKRYHTRKDPLIFIISLIIPLVYFRIITLLFYEQEYSLIRKITGLSIHHLHYGTILITISLLLLIFYKKNTLSVILGGIGLGMILDEFIPSLYLNIGRETEITLYNQSLISTVILFIAVTIITLIIWKSNLSKK